MPVVLILHYGYEGARPEPYTGGDMLAAFAPGLERLNAILIAPDVTGGDWTSPANEKTAIWLVKSVLESYDVDKSQVLVTGFSMGGEGTWFLGSRHQDLFSAAIPVAAPIAGRGATWNIPVYAIHSDNDELISYSATERFVDGLSKAGADVHLETVSGYSHFDTGRYAGHLDKAVLWIQGR